MRRFLHPCAGALALALTTISCIGSSPSPPATSSGAPSAPTASTPASGIPLSPEAALRLAALPGRLLIHTGRAGLATSLPDGTGWSVLAGEGDGVVDVLDAAWAPDARHVAWSQVDQESGLAVERLVVTDPRGGARVSAEMAFTPFFVSWDPTSARIGLLGNGATTLRLAVADVGAGTPRVADVAQGRPFYFSWSPSGSRLVTNRNDGGLERLDLDGRTERLDPKIGVYQSPVWSSDGATIFYVRIRQGLAQELLARPTGRGPAAVLAVGRGAVYFVASPDGGSVAFHAREPSELDFYDRSLPEHATDLGVTVVDIDTGELTRVSADPAIAWSWSPDGRLLAILEPVYTPEGTIVFRWHVVGGRLDYRTAAFVAPVHYLEAVVPFFTQYAQSGSMWSPDSAAFAYPTDTPEGSRIVVQPVGTGETGVVVGVGDAAVWSPR
jgi:hypothetical protein